QANAGSLREAVCYPEDTSAYSDRQIECVLDLVGLTHERSSVGGSYVGIGKDDLVVGEDLLSTGFAPPTPLEIPLFGSSSKLPNSALLPPHPLDRREHWSMILSAGEAQRLEMAHALLSKPEWLFLDESTSNLAADQHAQLYKILRKNLPPTTGVLSVSHNTEKLAEVHDVHYVVEGVVTVLNGPHRLSDRVKHKLISEIKDAAIYKDLDRLKDITRHVCRVLSKKSKTKSPSASALDFQEEIVDISRPFHNRSLRQAEANNVEATITNDHIKTFKCQRCLSNDHSTVLCPASDPSGSVCTMSLPDERTYHVHEVFRPRPFCSGLSSQGAETDGIGPMPVEQRKMIFDRVKAKRTPTTTTVKDSQVSLVALSTSKTRSDSSLTNIDIYLNTEKLRYKQPALGKDANSFASPGTSKTLKMMETILTECSSGLLKPSTISSLGRGLAVEKIVEGSVEGSFSDFSLGTAKLA
ncbi:ATP-binding cassette sub- D member 4, partial [Perkinsus olseni]